MSSIAIGIASGLTFGFLVIGCAAADAAPKAGAKPATSCAKAAIRKARGDAEKAVRAKDFTKAIALLAPLLADCGDQQSVTDRAWLAGDLAVAYERNGQYVECARLMAPLTHPKSGLQEAGSDKLNKAIEFNLDRCSKAIDTKYVAVKPGGCSLTIDRAIASAAAPAALVPKGAAAACVALVPGKPAPKTADDDPDARDTTCPVVAVIWKGAKALERRDLPSDGASALGDDSYCCNLSAIAAGTMAGKTLVRVHGQGRECSGGTGDTASDVFYEWNGTTLIPSLDASLVYH
jgi:hypothetical protein